MSSIALLANDVTRPNEYYSNSVNPMKNNDYETYHSRISGIYIKLVKTVCIYVSRSQKICEKCDLMVNSAIDLIN